MIMFSIKSIHLAQVYMDLYLYISIYTSSEWLQQIYSVLWCANIMVCNYYGVQILWCANIMVCNYYGVQICGSYKQTFEQQKSRDNQTGTCIGVSCF